MDLRVRGSKYIYIICKYSQQAFKETYKKRGRDENPSRVEKCDCVIVQLDFDNTSYQ